MDVRGGDPQHHVELEAEEPPHGTAVPLGHSPDHLNANYG